MREWKMIKKSVVIGLIGMIFCPAVVLSAPGMPVAYIEPPVNVVNAELKNVLEEVFDKAGMQYRVDGDISGIKVSCRISEKMLLKDVLDNILGPRKIQWQYDEGLNLFRISTKTGTANPVKQNKQFKKADLFAKPFQPFKTNRRIFVSKLSDPEKERMEKTPKQPSVNMSMEGNIKDTAALKIDGKAYYKKAGELINEKVFPDINFKVESVSSREVTLSVSNEFGKRTWVLKLGVEVKPETPAMPPGTYPGPGGPGPFGYPGMPH